VSGAAPAPRAKKAATRNPLVPFILIGRLAFNVFFILTSVYCLMAFHPFTYERVVKDQIIGWLTTFVRLHPLWYWMAQAVGVATLLPDLKRQRGRRAVIGYLALAGASAVALTVHPVLSHLQNDRASLIWALVALTPLLALAAVDQVVARNFVVWGEPGAGEGLRLFVAALHTAVFVFTVYSVLFFLRLGGHGAEFPWRARVVVLLASFFLHVIPFMAGFIVLSAIQVAAGFWGRSALVEMALASLLAATLIALVFRNLVFPAMALRGWPATTMAGALAVALVAVLSGLAVRLREGDSEPVESGVALLLRPLSVVPTGSVRARRIGLACLAVLAGAMTAGAGIQDWNGLVQQLSALMAWVLVLAAFVTLLEPKAGGDMLYPLLFLTLLSLGAYRMFVSVQTTLPRTLGAPKINANLLLDRYAGYEPSFRVLHELLQARQSDDQGFFEFLQRHTNIPRAVDIKPIDVRFVAELKQSAARPPNIFVVVVDSLRPDYLSPFNPKVTFTPGLGRFGSQADVFKNTFSHYGATGLSEPSIWVGGMMPHKQYVQPFRPLNALQALLRAEKYRQFISVDNVLHEVVEVDDAVTPLDADIQVKDYDLCKSLEEFQGRLDGLTDRSRPLFLYTQAQNVHVARITREGTTNISGKPYPGFYPPYASRLERIDGCFGSFVDHLQKTGLWDESIVIFTADHGDSLGDEGRWGHAYMVNPEVMRIPLMVHLPGELGKRHRPDMDRVTFSTDITPTLYALLGHTPTLKEGPFGRPFYGGGVRDRPREWQLVVSSYGPVYGIVSEGGGRLFVADAVNYTTTEYDLAPDFTATRRQVTPESRELGFKRIRQGIEELDALYKVPPLQ
jgi:hypothetical protein